jgi:hypothetical protein
MDNLSVHRSKWVRELIEQRGCQLRLLPGYSPDLNPIEGAFSKVKNLISKAKARTLDALFEAASEALAEVSSSIAATGRHRPDATGPLNMRTALVASWRMGSCSRSEYSLPPRFRRTL